MPQTQQLSSSLEDYLEAIYALIEENGSARVKNIGARLSVAAPSVTNALQLLKKRKLINHAPYGEVTLTREGKRRAKAITHRHTVLREFFTKVLAVDPEMAESCACKMEHAVPDLVLERFVEYVHFEDNRTRGGTIWMDEKGFSCKSYVESNKRCNACADSAKNAPR